MFLTTAQLVAAVALIPVVLWQGYRTQGRIYSAMAADEMQVEIGYQRRSVIRRVRVVAGIVLFAVCFGFKFGMSAVSGSTLQWGSIVVASLLLVGCIVVFLDFVLLWLQKRSGKKK